MTKILTLDIQEPSYGKKLVKTQASVPPFNRIVPERFNFG